MQMIRKLVIGSVLILRNVLNAIVLLRRMEDVMCVLLSFLLLTMVADFDFFFVHSI